MKSKKRITHKNGQDFVVQCKYERLGDFFFTCGLVSHTDHFCRRNGGHGLGHQHDGGPVRVPTCGFGKKETQIGRENSNKRFGGGKSGERDKELMSRRDLRANEMTSITNSIVMYKQYEAIIRGI